MSYLVLARKYRPRSFAEVCEQEVATKTLRGSISENRIGHAYLLHGPRGTGKTTMARIFAKALECERGPTPDPCGVCAHCRAIDAGSEVDVLEIDAASNNGVDDVRDLREVVSYAPLEARFKIYIVDEVHMMSKQAFNAFLKTLEEPPPHVKFIFATTELDKVIETVRSRCQLVPLSLLREDAIAARLATVFAAEKVAVGSEVVDELARLARGSMRDALSLSDQLLALSGDAIGIEDVRRLAGAGGPERVGAVLDALERRDPASVLAALERSDGSESVLVDALIEHLRGALIALHCGERSQLFHAEESERARRRARAERLGPERLERWLQRLVAVRVRLDQLSGHSRVLLELALLDLARAEASVPLADLVERLHALEERLARASNPAARSATGPGAPASSAQTRQSAASVPAAPSVPAASSSPAAPSAPAAPGRGPSAAQSPAGASAVKPSATASASSAAPSAGASNATLAPAPAQRTSYAPRAASNSSSAWSALVADVRGTNAVLGEALGRCGKLLDLGAHAAHVALARMRDEDRALLLDPATQAVCEHALTRLVGRPLRVVFEDASRRPPGERDEFTRSVTDLFQGHIDEH